ncbi:hypothetical protein G6F43_009433 [Rhizopus delemar]|nr:hypothetical protein G6F43_009433 [Rhizopus delemar]
MYRITASLTSKIIKAPALSFHTAAPCSAVTRFNLPAMSPTMTEGTIHKWKKQEGDTFAAGDVLLELETDKAQIDVEAAEDGVLAKIILQEGSKAPVNTLIALIAEEGDDISSVEIPKEEEQAAAPKEEAKEEKKAPEAKKPAVSPISHHDIDTSKLKKPLSPAVLSLVLKYGIKDVGSIKPSGYGGRILKGDVLGHLGLIAPKPAPMPNFTAAPPRDQIVFAKTDKPAVKEEEKKVVPPTFISKQIVIDELFSLRDSLNEQHGTHVGVNDFIAKAAERALQDVTAKKMPKKTSQPVVYPTTASSFAENKKYGGGEFKIFHLAEPTYDFITDSHQPSKPYVLTVDRTRSVTVEKKKSEDQEMVDLIGYLGGEKKKKEGGVIGLKTNETRLDFTKQEKKYKYNVQVKLDGGVPGKILKDTKATAFLDRVEYYVRNPNELVTQ